MYVQHFSLRRRPFSASPTGNAVFVGPQSVTAIASLRNALAATDACIALSGPAGVGKTTLINRTLAEFGEHNHIVRIARIRVDSESILEHLLDALGTENIPSGSIRKFTKLRNSMQALHVDGARLFVVVEDATRLDADTLAELEALTAADAGESDGASLALMGDERLKDLLASPLLARLRQRCRQAVEITGMSAAELRGYLRHSLRLAGSDFDRLFAPEAANLIHFLSDGTPRMANNLVESAMSAAADNGDQQVPTALIVQVAESDYGLSADGFEYRPPAEPQTEVQISGQADAEEAAQPEPEVAEPVAAEPVEAEPVETEPVEAEPVVAGPVEAEPVVAERVEAESEQTEPEQAMPPVLDAPAVAEVAVAESLPDLAELAPDLAKGVDAEESSSVDENTVAELEKLELAQIELDAAMLANSGESAADEVADWDRDPTFEELLPDLQALEAAMAENTQAANTQGAEHQEDVESQAAAEIEPPVLQPESAAIPEITLDNAINQGVAQATIDDDVEPAPEPVKHRSRSAAADPIDKISKELEKAKSLEDFDESMAETLFGGEFSLAGSQLVSPEAAPAADPQPPAERPAPNASRPAAAAIREEAAAQPAVEAVTDSIEDQIEVSTQTLRALNISPPQADEDESQSGFFSRFKRT